MPRCDRSTLLRAAFIIALTLLAYLPAIRGGFIWDDDTHVTDNAALRSLKGLRLIWTTLGATPQYYPLTHTTFWVEYHLWSGHPLGFHLVNVLLHIGTSLLLWRVLVTLELPGAWFAAALFALHPVQAETVAWISERKNCLSGFFYMLAALLMLSGASWRWCAAAFAAFVLAVLSKTVAGSLPAALLLVLWWKRRKPARAQVLTLVLMFAVAIVMGGITASMERWSVGAVGKEWDYSTSERLLIAGRAVWFYLYKLAVPINLSFIYTQWTIDPATLWQWIFPLAAIGLVVALFVLHARIGRGALVAVLFFGGTLVPALGFANLYPMRYAFVADHFQYLACIGIFCLFASAVNQWEPWNGALPVVLAALTFHRATIFSDSQRLWEDTLEKNPTAWIAHDHLGYLMLAQGDIAQAAGHFQRAVEINPDHVEAYFGMADVMQRIGRPDEAVAQMRRAVSIRPNHPRPYYMLGLALLSAGDTDAAIAEFNHSLQLEPRFFLSRLKLAEVYRRLGQSDKADEQIRAVRSLIP